MTRVVRQNLILAMLLGLAAIAWIVLTWQSAISDKQKMDIMGGMDAYLFIIIWIIMMVAVMFPTAAPMILIFARIYEEKRKHGIFVPTWVFIASYLFVWSFFGILAYILAFGAEELGNRNMIIISNGARIGGFVLILAGLYQFSPLKYSCLSKCRSPVNFILNCWHDGYGGSFRMGLEHGLYCLGCCWLLFIILFPLGIMNIGVLLIITLLIFAEKSMVIGQQIAKMAGAVLALYGILIIFMPEILPIMT